jgi:hypothetical protein
MPASGASGLLLRQQGNALPVELAFKHALLFARRARLLRLAGDKSILPRPPFNADQGTP